MKIEPADRKRLARVRRCFDDGGRLQRWPSRRADQDLVLWVIWWQLPSDGQLTELEVNAMLRTWHDFQDYVLLRRELCELDLLRRTPDGGIYLRVARTAPEALDALITQLEQPSAR